MPAITQMTPIPSPSRTAVAMAKKNKRRNFGPAPCSSSRSYRRIAMSPFPLSSESRRQHALPALAREDRIRERGDKQNADGKDADYDERLQSVDHVLILGDPRRNGGQKLEHEPLKDHQARQGH